MSVDPRKVAGAGVALMALGSLVGILVPAGLGWDFGNFYDAGHKALVGQVEDLYVAGVPVGGRESQGAMAFWSVPLASYLLAPLALFPPEVALPLFKLQNTVAIVASLAILHRMALPFLPASGLDEPWFTALFVWLALLFQPLWTVFRVGGQTTPTVLLLLTVGLYFHVRARWWVSSLCYVLAVILKPAFALGLAFAGLVSGLAFFGATAAWGLGLAAVAIAVMGWDVHEVFLQQVLRTGERSTAWMYNSALTVPLENLRMLSVPGETAGSRPPAIALSIQLVRGAVVILFGWLALRARKLSEPGRRHALFVLSIFFALLAGPVVWEHYLALLFIPLSYLLAVRTRLDRATLLAVGGIFGFALFQNLILVLWLRDTLAIESPVGLLAIGLFKAAPLILAVVVVSLRGGLLGSYAHPGWTSSHPPAHAVAG